MKGQIIGGIICLSIAALLGVLSWRLSEDELMFMVGRVNIPMIVLAVAGVLLLITARKR